MAAIFIAKHLNKKNKAGYTIVFYTSLARCSNHDKRKLNRSKRP